MIAEITACPDCNSEHIGRRCGMTFAQRIKTVKLNKANFDTVDKSRFYDPEPVREMFGEDSRERMMEETHGIGPVSQGSDGTFYKRKGQDAVPLTSRETETLLGTAGAQD